MSARRWPTVELGGGAGVVGAFAGVALFVADGDRAGPLVDAVRDAVSLGPPPGRRLARRLAALVTAEDDDGTDDLADFGLVAETEDGWVVLLRGAVEAIVSTAGVEEIWSGTSSATWSDRLVPVTVEAALLLPAGSARPGTSALRVDAGVVPGGWLRVTATADEAAPPGPPDFEIFSLSPEGVDERPPLPVEGLEHPPAPDAEPADDAPSPAPVARWPAPDDERVSLGLLVFDDGSVFGLDDDYVLGREPEIDDRVAVGNARPIPLDDPAGTVSRVHAEVQCASPDVVLIDRGSTNGTHVWDGSKGAWDRLTPGEPRVIRPGERGAVGRRTFVYEGLAAPGTSPGVELRGVETVRVSSRLGALTGEDGAVHPLDRSYVIGREPLTDDDVRRGLASPIVIRDERVSRVHTYVSVAGDVVTVRDAGTVAGTFIASPGASEWEVLGPDPVELAPGWSLSVGPHVFTFRDDA